MWTLVKHKGVKDAKKQRLGLGLSHVNFSLAAYFLFCL